MDEFVVFYADNLRGSLFSAFMTLTGFLFTLHTFLLVTLHRDIYSKKNYQDWNREMKKYDTKLDPNKPLKNISKVLFFALVTSFIAAILQLTVGLIACFAASMICLAFASFAALVFAFVLYVFRQVIADWIAFLDKESNQEAAPTE